MNREEYNDLNRMMKLERENAEMRLKIKQRERLIERLKAKIKRLEKGLTREEMDLLEILEKRK